MKGVLHYRHMWVRGGVWSIRSLANKASYFRLARRSASSFPLISSLPGTQTKGSFIFLKKYYVLFNFDWNDAHVTDFRIEFDLEIRKTIEVHLSRKHDTLITRLWIGHSPFTNKSILDGESHRSIAPRQRCTHNSSDVSMFIMWGRKTS